MRTHRLALAFFVMASLLAFVPAGSNASSLQPFGVSVSVRLCDYTQDPADLDIEFMGPSAYCEIEADGASVTATTEDGTELDSCVITSQITPNGGLLNGCTIDGAELNSTLTFELDESTMPSGFAIQQNPIVIEIGNEIPGGGESSVVSFVGEIGELSEAGETPQGESGFSADLRSGECGSTADVVDEFAPIALEEGEHVGAFMWTAPLVVVETVDVNLDILIDERHAISVYQDGELFLCGDIGGVNNADGKLHIVLNDVATSEYAGMATLSYNQADRVMTDIVIYLIPLNAGPI